MIENRNEFKNLLEEFFHKFSTGITEDIRNEYNDSFRDGSKKAQEVLQYLKRLSVPMEKLAYVSIGGADGSEIEYVLANTAIERGILLEYDREFCEEARNKKIDNLEIFDGDAWHNRKRVAELLLSWKERGLIDGVVITAFSVIHELKFRADKDYDHFEFLASLIPKMSQAYFYCKEPTKFTEWNGRVKLSLPDWLSSEDLFRFGSLLQKQFRDKHSVEFNYQMIEHDDGVIMDSQLAAEIIKKLVYFIQDKSVSKLLIEVEECHTALDPIELSDTIHRIFKKGDNNYDSKVNKRNVSSERFQDFYDLANIQIDFIDNRLDWIPSAFTKFSAYFRPKMETKDSISTTTQLDTFPASDKQLILKFYEDINARNYENAFSLLSEKFRNDKWGNDLEYFINGYENTHNILAVIPTEIERRGNFSLWLIYYNELLHVFQEPVISNIWKSKLGDIDKTFEQIKSYKKLLIEKLNAKPNEIDKIPLLNFLSANAVEETTWLSKVDYEKAEQLFTKELKSMSRTKYIHCSKTNGRWFINDIRLVTHSSEPFL